MREVETDPAPIAYLTQGAGFLWLCYTGGDRLFSNYYKDGRVLCCPWIELLALSSCFLPFQSVGMSFHTCTHALGYMYVLFVSGLYMMIQ